MSDQQEVLPPEWEIICKGWGDEQAAYTYRLRVPGGWLYRHQSTNIDAVPCMAFVPDPAHAVAAYGLPDPDAIRTKGVAE
jgi:hypothetical protein